MKQFKFKIKEIGSSSPWFMVTVNADNLGEATNFIRNRYSSDDYDSNLIHEVNKI